MESIDQRVDRREHSHERYEDEISLTDLIVRIWRDRWVAVWSGLLVLLLAALYLFFVKPIYKSEAYLLPPSEQDIAQLNLARRFGLLGFDSDRVFNEFLTVANSKMSRRKYFDERGLLDQRTKGNKEEIADQIFETQFDKKLEVIEPKKSAQDPFTKITFESTSAKKSAVIANNFIQFAADVAAQRLLANLQADIQGKIKELTATIAGKRKIARQRREDIINQYNEAIAVAKKLSLKKPQDYQIELGLTGEGSDLFSINTAELPLYARGTLALTAELEVLKSRDKDDPFIDGLRDLQETIASLNEIPISVEAFRVVKIDRPAQVPYQPERPQKHLVLVVALFIAGVAACLSALAWEFVRHLIQHMRYSAST